MGVHGGVECCAGNYGGRHYKTVVGKVCSHCDCRRLVGCGVGRHCGGAGGDNGPCGGWSYCLAVNDHDCSDPVRYGSLSWLRILIKILTLSS